MGSHLPPHDQGPAARIRAFGHTRTPPGPPLPRPRSSGTSTRWRCPPRACSAHRKRPPTVPCPTTGQGRHGRLHAGMNQERVIPAGQGQQPQHVPLRRGQHHIAAGAPGEPLHPQQSAKRSAIDEVKRRHGDEQAPAQYHQGRNRLPSVRRAGNVQVPSHGHENMTSHALVLSSAPGMGPPSAKLAGPGLDPTVQFLEICVSALRRRHKTGQGVISIGGRTLSLLSPAYNSRSRPARARRSGPPRPAVGVLRLRGWGFRVTPVLGRIPAGRAVRLWCQGNRA